MHQSTKALLADTPKSEFPNNGDKGTWKQHLANWGAYAAATGTALAMATNASASIIASAPDLDLTVSTSPGPKSTIFTIGGVEEVLAIKDRSNGSTRLAVAVIASGPGIAHLNFKANASSSARRYALGQRISAAGTVSHSAGLFLKEKKPSGPTSTFGYFGPKSPQGFVGFVNTAGDLGWVQVQVGFDQDDYPAQLELISWAYNDVPGASINAGQTTEGSPTPEPGTEGLALLALGAAGILALRKRRSQLAVK